MKHLVEAQINELTSEVHGFEDIENSNVLMRELMKFAFQDMHTKKYTKQIVRCTAKLEESVEEGMKANGFSKWMEICKFVFHPEIFQDPAELGVQPKGPGITYADPQTTRVKTSKDPVSPPPR